MKLIEQLARDARELDFAVLPPDVVDCAKISILDTFGVMLAGAVDAAPRLLDQIDNSGGEGAALLLTSGRRGSALDAAMINGTAAHALDFDTSNDTFSGHPTVHLLPALLALADEVDVSGKAFIAAYVAGFELQSRIARGVHPTHFQMGWFCTGTIGVFGAAAAASHLLGLDSGQIEQALSIAASLASGSTAHAGSMTKPLGAGQSARSGVLAARLAQAGFTAASDGLDDRRGFLALFQPAAKVDRARIIAGAGDSFDILETLVGIKQYPCCGRFHSSVDLLRDLMTAHDLHAGDLAHIRTEMATTRLAHFDRPHPRDCLEAKFSIQYCLARTALDGRPRICDFNPAALQDSRLPELMSRVEAVVDPAMPAAIRRHEEGGARVILKCHDGRVFEARAVKPHGRVPGKHLPNSVLEEKFLECAVERIDAGSARDVLGILQQFEHLEAVSEIGWRVEKDLATRAVSL